MIFFVFLYFLFSNISFATPPPISTCNTVFSKTPKTTTPNIKEYIWKINSQTTQGTGFFISPNQFVTNFHILDNLSQRNRIDHIILSQDNNPQKLKAKSIQKISSLHDLAILKIDGEVENYLTLKKEQPLPTEKLSVIGYPKGFLTIAEKTGPLINNNEVFYTFPVNQDIIWLGASGSPVLDEKNQVAGILFISSHNMLSMIKIDNLRNLLEEKVRYYFNLNLYMEREIQKLKKLSEEGSAYAQYQLAHIYYHKKYIPRHYQRAFYWYEKSSNQDLAIAQYELSRMYLEGKGVPQNYEKAIYWMKRAAKQNFTYAQYELGDIYEHDYEYDMNKEAFYWYQKAAEQNHIPSQNRLENRNDWE